MAKFKVGDRVRIASDERDYNHSGEGVGYEFTIAEFYSDYAREYVGKSTGVHTKLLELVRVQNETGPAPVNFILQYELDEDPFETFATMKEVEARIKELSLRSDLKRESIKVYEIAKTYDVSLETRVIFNGLLEPKVRMEERVEEKIKKPAKRGPHFKCPDCGSKFTNRRGLGIHKGRTHK